MKSVTTVSHETTTKPTAKGESFVAVGKEAKKITEKIEKVDKKVRAKLERLCFQYEKNRFLEQESIKKKQELKHKILQILHGGLNINPLEGVKTAHFHVKAIKSFEKVVGVDKENTPEPILLSIAWKKIQIKEGIRVKKIK